MPRRYTLHQELEERLKRKNLNLAVAVAKEIEAENQGRPLPLTAWIDFLPLVAMQQPERYEAWARKWLRQYMDTEYVTLDKYVDVADAILELRTEPAAIDTLKHALR